MSSRSAPTATTVAPYAGSAHASSSAWRLVPVPDTSTTRRAVRRVGTAGVYRAGAGTPGPVSGVTTLAPGGQQPAEQATAAEGDDRVHQHLPGGRPDLGHPAGADGSAGDRREHAEQHRGEHPGDQATQGALVPGGGRVACAGCGPPPARRARPAAPAAPASRPASGRCPGARRAAGTSAPVRRRPRSARPGCRCRPRSRDRGGRRRRTPRRSAPGSAPGARRARRHRCRCAAGRARSSRPRSRPRRRSGTPGRRRRGR